MLDVSIVECLNNLLRHLTPLTASRRRSRTRKAFPNINSVWSSMARNWRMTRHCMTTTFGTQNLWTMAHWSFLVICSLIFPRGWPSWRSWHCRCPLLMQRQNKVNIGIHWIHCASGNVPLWNRAIGHIPFRCARMPFRNSSSGVGGSRKLRMNWVWLNQRCSHFQVIVNPEDDIGNMFTPIAMAWQAILSLCIDRTCVYVELSKKVDQTCGICRTQWRDHWICESIAV